MAIDWRTEWEVRTDGNDNLGGGFAPIAGATKTPTDNYTYGPSYQAWTGSNLQIHGTNTSLVRSATRAPVTDDIGHVLRVVSGTGFTAGVYQILGVQTDSGVDWWLLDRAAGTAGSTGGSWGLGGALATPGRAGGSHVAGNTVWIRQGTYSMTTNNANVANGRLEASALSGYCTRVIGYASVRGDGGVATVQAGSGVSGSPLRGMGAQTVIANISASATNISSGEGVIRNFGSAINCHVTSSNTNGFYDVSRLAYCSAMSCASVGFFTTNTVGMLQIYASIAIGCGTGFHANASSQGGFAVGAVAHKCTTGFTLIGQNSSLLRYDGCIASRCTNAFRCDTPSGYTGWSSVTLSNCIVTRCTNFLSGSWPLDADGTARFKTFVYVPLLFVYASGSLPSQLSDWPTTQLASDPCPGLVDSTNISASDVYIVGPWTGQYMSDLAWVFPGDQVRRPEVPPKRLNFDGGFTL
jgi:hypothetical protein